MRPDAAASRSQRRSGPTGQVSAASPDYRDQGPVAGRYVVKGDEVTFDFNNCPTGCGAPETVRWSYFDGQLTFAIVDVADTGSRVIYTAHPWRKTG